MTLETRQELISALEVREAPTVVSWNRLEGRPRTADFETALRAEVRDPLWMLCRQWQLGEFRAEDAGSPSEARILLESRPLTTFRAGDQPASAFSDALPLEAQVERQPFTFDFASGPVALNLRLVFGRRFAKCLRRDGLAGYLPDFLARYPVERPDAADVGDAAIVAHSTVWQRFAAAAGRVIDGGELYKHLAMSAANRPQDGIGGIAPADEAALTALGEEFRVWVAELFQLPGVGQDAWQPVRLEYRCSAATEAPGTELVANEYFHGRIDWYHFDRSEFRRARSDAALAPENAIAFIPAPVTFDGMPHPRWWQFEDGTTHFGGIDPSTTDLSKLVFMEHVLLYANDWFLFPHRVRAGATAEVLGLSVTNVFGERFWIEAAGSAPGDGWQNWGLFANSAVTEPNDTADRRLAILPTVPKIQDAEQSETVLFIRDEMANQVWAIERAVRLPSGRIARGSEAAHETRRFFSERVASEDAAAMDSATAVRYDVMTPIPENWIPFVPVHQEGDHRETRLQRAAMPRLIEGDPELPERVRPRSALLRRGLDEGTRSPYFIDEEEVPRAGIAVRDGFRRTRWYGGATVLWRGLRKHTGRGEGSSGLAFDRLVPKRPAVPTEKPLVAPAGHQFLDYQGAQPPAVVLDASRDAARGWNLRVSLTHFSLAPENASGEHADGEGHLHLYVNGVKCTRVYGEWFHLPDLLEGEHEVRVDVSSNNHSPITVGGEAVQSVATISQPEPVPHIHMMGDEVVPDARAPTVHLTALEDAMGGWNLRFDLTDFELTPVDASGPHVAGAGHLHLYVGGVKYARVYTNWHYLPPLAAGTHEITVRLSTNDHRLYATSAGPIESSLELLVEGSTVASGGEHGH